MRWGTDIGKSLISPFVDMETPKTGETNQPKGET